MPPNGISDGPITTLLSILCILIEIFSRVHAKGVKKALMVFNVALLLTKRLLLKDLPVSMLSLTMQFPLMRTASHCIMQPRRGISMMSPGTRSSDDMS